MDSKTMHNLHRLIQESQECYDWVVASDSQPNMDFASFAATTHLQGWREALGSTALDADQLALWLREARQQARGREKHATAVPGWSRVMAVLLARRANMNAAT